MTASIILLTNILRIIKKILSIIFNSIQQLFSRLFGPLFLKLGLVERMVLIRMDGGICSQMHFYLIGCLFQEKGYQVKFDLEFYHLFAKDINGIFDRNFDLLKAFPNLNFQVASKFEQIVYQTFKCYNDYTDIKDPLKYLSNHPPVYFTGWFRDPLVLYERIPSIFSFAHSHLSSRSVKVLKIIENTNYPVAIHVRRGDLSVFNFAYGEPVSSQYFNHAIKYIESQIGPAFYFIFSDEPDWVRENLILNLEIGLNYYIVDVNGSDKGYQDLFLIASCKHQITSKGSLGKYGGFLCPHEGNIITICDDKYERMLWERQHSNIVFIN